MTKQEQSFEMARRLKDLREERNLSHDKLKAALSEQFGITISRDSLMSYEIQTEPHSKIKNGKYPNLNMGVEYLNTFAQFYGVSTDYILGLSKHPTLDAQAAGAAEYTGLSLGAIETLHGLSEYIKAHPAGYIQNPYDVLLSYDGPEYTLQPEGARVSASKVFRVSLAEYLHERSMEVGPETVTDLDDESNAELLSLSEQLATIGYTVVPKQRVTGAILQDACDALKALFTEYGDNMRGAENDGKH